MDIDTDVVVQVKKGHFDIFNLQKTIDHPNFTQFYRLREKVNSVPDDRFGKDLTRHFELAFKVLTLLEESGIYEVYEEDDDINNSNHPFNKDINDKDL